MNIWIIVGVGAVLLAGCDWIVNRARRDEAEYQQYRAMQKRWR